MRAEYSLVGYISTDSLLMSPYSSDDGNSFTIKSSRLISKFTLLAFAQSRLTRADLSYLLRGMTFKVFFLLLICSRRLQ